MLRKTEKEIYYEVIPEMEELYRANEYDILLKNCNHFCDDFLRRLTNGQFSLPAYLNRAARIGSWFHCVVP